MVSFELFWKITRALVRTSSSNVNCVKRDQLITIMTIQAKDEHLDPGRRNETVKRSQNLHIFGKFNEPTYSLASGRAPLNNMLQNQEYQSTSVTI